MSKLTHDHEEHQYTLHLPDGKEAYVNYVLESKMMKLTYSYVPPELRGGGVGKELVEKTFEMLTEEGYEAEAMCSYIRAVAERHEKWSTIID
ncbi:MAG: putative GNAT family acetyltransferase [Flavobacteriaceae bacterium]|jgi:predicted GNAT family acetyltransferase